MHRSRFVSSLSVGYLLVILNWPSCFRSFFSSHVDTVHAPLKHLQPAGYFSGVFTEMMIRHVDKLAVPKFAPDSDRGHRSIDSALPRLMHLKDNVYQTPRLRCRLIANLLCPLIISDYLTSSSFFFSLFKFRLMLAGIPFCGWST